MTRIWTGKDFWSGAMFVCFAAVGLFASRNYAMGSSGEMGPRYFRWFWAFFSERSDYC